MKNIEMQFILYIFFNLLELGNTNQLLIIKHDMKEYIITIVLLN